MGAFLAACAISPVAAAQQPAQGFAVERFYPSAPGAGWLVMDALDLYGGLGGDLSLTAGYARDPLVIRGDAARLPVVSDEAFADIGAAIRYDRWRFTLDTMMPLAINGTSGSAAGYAFTAPDVHPGTNPDIVSDVRIGADVRIFGRRRGPFRLGASAQLFVPNGNRADYDSDHTFRGMFRVLFAGDARWFSYAGHIGAHVRPLGSSDQELAPGSPQGHELLFGFGAGARLPLGARGWDAILGPEVFGATALLAPSAGTTAIEGLLSSRFEGPLAGGFGVRVKLGAGLGSDQRFGAPAWRALAGVEMFTR